MDYQILAKILTLYKDMVVKKAKSNKLPFVNILTF